MQFSVNEWIKSGRYPPDPPPRLHRTRRAIERDTLSLPLPSSCPFSRRCSRNTRLISRSQSVGRRVSLEPNYGLPLFSCLASVHAAQKSRSEAPKVTLREQQQARLDRDLAPLVPLGSMLVIDYFRSKGLQFTILSLKSKRYLDKRQLVNLVKNLVSFLKKKSFMSRILIHRDGAQMYICTLVATGRGIVSVALNLQARLQQQLNRAHWHARNRKPRRSVCARAKLIFRELKRKGSEVARISIPSNEVTSHSTRIFLLDVQLEKKMYSLTDFFEPNGIA